MYLVQNANHNHNPRSWSSYTNIHFQEIVNPRRMNSTEEISRYNNHNGHYYSPVLARRHGGHSYDVVQVPKSPKKDKKWSFGNLFRIKKKIPTDSSSEGENETKFFSNKKKKKSDKRKHVNSTVGFDHVVIPPSSRYSSRVNGFKNHEDLAAVLSEPHQLLRSESNNYFPASTFTRKFVPLKGSQESVDSNSVLNKPVNTVGLPGVNSLGRKKKVVKARAEARRDTSNGGDSSDDDSQISAFRSEESLNKIQDGLARKRSRAARTLRYLRRMSKDEDPRDHLPISKCHSEQEVVRNKKLPRESKEKPKSQQAERPQLNHTNSAPTCRPNLIGLSTIPPNHSSYSKYRTISSTNGSTYNHNSYSSLNSVNPNLRDNLSLSCEANIHRNNSDADIVNGHFPLGNVNNRISNLRYPPPPPPPRDPKRVLTVQNSEGRPISYSFENGRSSHSDRRPHKPHVAPDTRQNFMNPHCRSTSEDHIFWNPLQRISLVPRPSSTTPQANRLQQLNCEKPTNYRYLTDKNPRSRKPICIQSFNNNNNDGHSENSAIPPPAEEFKPRNTFKFWQQKEKENAQESYKKLSPERPQMFTAHTQVSTRVFLPNHNNGINNNLNNNSSHLNELLETIKQPVLKEPSPEVQNNSVDVVDCVERKSSNLEDALDELEAIYNSLHLGDEDLLDRAEQREMEAAKKQRDANLESYPSSMSDSCFAYDNSDANRKKRFIKRHETDRKLDDMAFRKLNKKLQSTGDQQNAVSKISYLLASPVFGVSNNEEKSFQNKNSNEPDVTFDDVVYRNVKHSNNTLKVMDPQPPFGIPVGPISLASNNDYLHATAEVAFTKKTNVPDVVKDDMAYRNLRKDSSKQPAFMRTNFHVDDAINNNDNGNNFKVGERFKKKRAVRSLSENIFNLMQNELNSELSKNDYPNENISDVADALQIARQILKDKENKINGVRKAYMSDDDAKKRRLLESNSFRNKLQVNMPNGNGNCSASDSTSSEKDSKSISKDEETSLDGFITSLTLENFDKNDGSSSSNSLKKEVSVENFVPDESSKDTDTFSKSSSLSQLLSEIDSFAEQSFSSDKNFEFVLDKKPILAATKVESEPFEQVDKINIEPILYETVANIVITPKNSNLDQNIITTEVFSDSDHDYANIQSSDDLEGKQNESRVFEEISADILELTKLADNSQHSSQRNSYVKSDDSSESNKIIENINQIKGEESVGNSWDATTTQACVYTNKICFDINNVDKEVEQFLTNYNEAIGFETLNDDCMESLKAPKLVQNVKAKPVDQPECENSDGFIGSTNKPEFSLNYQTNCDNQLDDVDDVIERNVPFHVNLSQLSTCDTKEIQSVDRNIKVSKENLAILKLEKDSKLLNDNKASKSELQSLQERRHNESTLPRNSDEGMTSHSWYEDPSVIALACSCGIACTSQLPSFDIIFMLGLIFAIILLLFALIART